MHNVHKIDDDNIFKFQIHNTNQETFKNKFSAKWTMLILHCIYIRGAFKHLNRMDQMKLLCANAK